MKPLLLSLLILTFQSPASKTTTKIPAEIIALRKEFVKTTEEYKASLVRLKEIYEQNVVRAEEKLAMSRKLLSEGLISHTQVEQNERALAAEKEKVIKTDRDLADADKQMKDALDDAKFEAEYRRSLTQRKKERRTACSRWSLTTYYKETKRSVEVSLRFVCVK